MTRPDHPDTCKCILCTDWDAPPPDVDWADGNDFADYYAAADQPR